METEMSEIHTVWKELENYNGDTPKSMQLSKCRVKMYKGAMEIPLVSFQPSTPIDLGAQRMETFLKLLESLELTLDCVEEERNYKINKLEDGQYIGRITTEALKLHAVRSKELGKEVFSKIAAFFIGETKND